MDESLPSAPQNPVGYSGYSTIGSVPIQNEKFDINDNGNAIRPAFQNVPHLSEDEAKLALSQFVSEHCCYGKGPLKEMVFTNFESSNTHRYVLQTFTESRTTAYACEPYHGSPIYITGQPLQPWDIPCVPKILFNNEVHKIEIPNTAHVENCTSCMGIGTKQCSSCQGRGSKTCWICNGTGKTAAEGSSNQVYDTFKDNHHEHHHQHQHHHHHHNPCAHCNGTGYAGCNVCHRAGRIQCHSCKGSGKLKWFLQLTVTYSNNENDYFKKSNPIPDDLIRNCSAHNAYSEQNTRVYSINSYPDPDINRASYELLNMHSSRFNNCRIIAQRQDVFVIPVTLCTYNWKDKANTFHVFGLDHSVYAPDYPKKCCCTIL